jgi:hypothetical protein
MFQELLRERRCLVPDGVERQDTLGLGQNSVRRLLPRASGTNSKGAVHERTK